MSLPDIPPNRHSPQHKFSLRILSYRALNTYQAAIPIIFATKPDSHSFKASTCKRSTLMPIPQSGAIKKLLRTSAMHPKQQLASIPNDILTSPGFPCSFHVIIKNPDQTAIGGIRRLLLSWESGPLAVNLHDIGLTGGMNTLLFMRYHSLKLVTNV